MAKYAHPLLIVLAFACGGKAPRAPAPRVPLPAPAPVRAPAAREPAPPFTPSSIETLAPKPRIRVGLTTRAEAVRLTSSRPFRVGAPGGFIETQDVLVEPVRSTMIEGAVYRLQLGSFPSREAAGRFRSKMAEELDDELVLRREPASGRFAVRLGSFTTETGASARREDLRQLGFEGVSMAREPARAARPVELVLRPVGQPTLTTESLTLYAVPQAPGAWIEVDGVPYRGYVEVLVNRSNVFTLVNVVNLEDYLRGVVPAELSPEAFPEKEAIKAQALAARTYAEKRRGQFEAEGYDICSTPACQVYRGVAAEQTMATEAVNETAGEILTYEGKPVDALYTSTCGGRTENSENVFSAPQPYLVSRACFLESRGAVVETSRNAGPLSVEAATLAMLGIAPPSARDEPVRRDAARRWVEKSIAHLGQTPCWDDRGAPGAAVDIVELAALVAEGLCWERRLPFLLSALDAERLVPNAALSGDAQRHLAYAIQEGLILPEPEGIVPGKPLDRHEVHGTLYRLITSRGESPLRQGTLENLRQGRLTIRDDILGDANNEISTAFAPSRYLYRKTGVSIHYAERLSLLAGDRVLFHIGDGGVDLLVLLSEGGSFDRSSRFSHWVVRKSNEDLSREVNLRHRVGRIVELRPKRYGRSGRIVELEIVGTAGSVDVDGLAVRRALGIRENLFFLDAQRNATGSVERWVFTGRGWGHGVGMCQVGAFGMAAAGYSYRQILAHYYPGTQIQRTAAPAAARMRRN